MSVPYTPGVGRTLKGRTEGADDVVTHDVDRVGGQTPTLGAGAVAAGTQRMTLANDDPAVAALGTLNTNTGVIADAAVAAGATGSLHAKMRRVTQGLEDLKAGITALPLPTGAASAANQATIIGHIDTVETVLGLIEANTDGTETQATEINTRLGATNESSAAADNSTSGLNGLVKRLLARLTALLPAALTGGGGIKAGLVDALPAGTNLIGSVAAGDKSGTIYDGVTALTVKYAKIGCASLGDNTLVAGVTGPDKSIRVVSMFLAVTGTPVNIYFRNDTGGTAIGFDGTYSLTLDKTGATGVTGLSLTRNDHGHFQSAAGKPLVLNLSAAQGVGGWLSYVEV